MKNFTRRRDKLEQAPTLLPIRLPHTLPNTRSRRRQNKLEAKEQYGFWCNPNLPTWDGTSLVLSRMQLAHFFNLYKRHRPAYHNLCTVKTPPHGVDQLLWNGLKFCVEHPLPKPQLDQTFDRLQDDIRRRYFWSSRGGADNSSYEKKLYIKSDWTPEQASPILEQALQQFRTQIYSTAIQNLQQAKRQHNIPSAPRKLLQTLSDSPDFIVLPTDKNLGPAILERSVYKQRCLLDHLLDTKTYRQLTQTAATLRLESATRSFKDLIRSHQKQLPDSETTYFKRCFLEERRLPQFYCTPKVHKKPHWKTRPIVSCVNSRMGDLSKWADVQLQKVVHLCPGYLKDSKSLIKRLKRLGKLPPTAALVTSDAVSMYTNIDTIHGMETLKLWLTLHVHELPDGYPTDMVLKAVHLVMFNNIFQFDDTFWLQLTGTAMGTSLACIYATIYFSYHEETRILPGYSSGTAATPIPTLVPLAPVPPLENPALLLHARLIDDAFQIWDLARLPTDIRHNFIPHMEHEMNFGSLSWEVEQPARSVNFLDLTIAIESDGSITTRTFVKAMNLHLYIPPTSAHPKGVLKSLIFGNLQRYWHQNSRRDDFIFAASAFYGHLLNRGYTTEVLNETFQEAAATIDNKSQKMAAMGEQLWDPSTVPTPSRLFIHWDYHPRDIGRQAIRQIFERTLAPALSDSGLTVDQLTIAYSVPKSLGQCLTKTQLDEAPSDKVSSYIEPMEPPANL
jgi:hypothetical protein